jgi:hypothetical protein
MLVEELERVIPIAYLYLQHWFISQLQAIPKVTPNILDNFEEDTAQDLLSIISKPFLLERVRTYLDLLGSSIEVKTDEEASLLLSAELSLINSLDRCYLKGDLLYFSIAGKLHFIKLLEVNPNIQDALVTAYCIKSGWTIEEFIGRYCRVITLEGVYETTLSNCSCQQTFCFHQTFVGAVLRNRPKYQFLLNQYEL